MTVNVTTFGLEIPLCNAVTRVTPLTRACTRIRERYIRYTRYARLFVPTSVTSGEPRKA